MVYLVLNKFQALFQAHQLIPTSSWCLSNHINKIGLQMEQSIWKANIDIQEVVICVPIHLRKT